MTLTQFLLVLFFADGSNIESTAMIVQDLYECKDKGEAYVERVADEHPDIAADYLCVIFDFEIPREAAQ